MLIAHEYSAEPAGTEGFLQAKAARAQTRSGCRGHRIRGSRAQTPQSAALNSLSSAPGRLPHPPSPPAFLTRENRIHGRPARHRPPRRDRHRPPPRPRQPARLHHRGDRHRQDDLAAAARRALLAHRRAGFHGRREGGPRGTREGRSDVRQARRAPEEAPPARARLGRMPRGVLGRLGRAGTPGARDDLGHGAAAALAAAQPQRHPGRRAFDRLQGRRRQRAPADRPQGPAGDAAVRRRQRREVQDPVRQHLAGVDRRDPARPAADRGVRAARSSSASRCSRSTT